MTFSPEALQTLLWAFTCAEGGVALETMKGGCSEIAYPKGTHIISEQTLDKFQYLLLIDSQLIVKNTFIRLDSDPYQAICSAQQQTKPVSFDAINLCTNQRNKLRPDSPFIRMLFSLHKTSQHDYRQTANISKPHWAKYSNESSYALWWKYKISFIDTTHCKHWGAWGESLNGKIHSLYKIFSRFQETGPLRLTGETCNSRLSSK